MANLMDLTNLRMGILCEGFFDVICDCLRTLADDENLLPFDMLPSKIGNRTKLSSDTNNLIKLY